RSLSARRGIRARAAHSRRSTVVAGAAVRAAFAPLAGSRRARRPPPERSLAAAWGPRSPPNAAPSRPAAGPPPAPAPPPREPRLEAEKAVVDKAERDRSARVVLFEGALRIAVIGAPSKAGGDREAQQHPHASRERDRDAHRPRERSAGDERRQPQHPVSDHAA